jgi:hypothetical protein
VNPGTTIDVGGYTLEWRERSKPHWIHGDGWHGLTLDVSLADGTGRGLVIEYELEDRGPAHDYSRQRLPVNAIGLASAIASAISAGWDPTSRGKPFSFRVPYSPNQTGVSDV